MWLLQDATLQPLEVQQLRQAGAHMVFAPGVPAPAPQTTLPLAPAVLDQLNAQDWHHGASTEAWELASCHFDFVFVGPHAGHIVDACRHFRGAIVVLTWAHPRAPGISQLLRQAGGETLQAAMNLCRKRLWFGKGFAYHAGLEDRFVAERSLLLPQHGELAWRGGLARMALALRAWRDEEANRPPQVRRKRLAVILPTGYRGGSLRGALALARALHLGSRQWGEDADIVFLHLDEPALYAEDDFVDCPPGIARRPFRWKHLTAPEARRAMRYAGYPHWEPGTTGYMVADDGMQQVLDCDLWLVISDRLAHPVLPLRPMVLMVFDYIQRYQPPVSGSSDLPYLAAARAAEKVLVSTELTHSDALQYAGIAPGKVRKLAMLAPEFSLVPVALDGADKPLTYFLWTTNAAPHKNHLHAAQALRIYYEELGGQWDCRVSGVGTADMTDSELPHLKAMAKVFRQSKALRQHVRWLGELPDALYQRQLAQAGFLWHAGRIDNGTFSVIEAACMGVPALSSDYPAMREIDQQFGLNLAWMDPDSPRHMAEQLRRLEQEALARRSSLPSALQLQAQRIEHHASAYWQELRICL
jgi:glycosyltransferase involved in cell wall biosynthesis